MSFSVKSVADGTLLTLTCSANLDRKFEPEFGAAVHSLLSHEHFAPCRAVVADMTQVSLIATTTLRILTLFFLAVRKSSKRLIIVGLPDELRKFISDAGISSDVLFADTFKEAAQRAGGKK